MSAVERLVEERDRREPGFAAAVETELDRVRDFDATVNAVLEGFEAAVTAAGWVYIAEVGHGRGNRTA
jgi:hypothetical protein